MKVRHVPAALAHDPGDVARNGIRSARHGSIISDYAAETSKRFSLSPRDLSRCRPLIADIYAFATAINRNHGPGRLPLKLVCAERL